MSERFWAQVRKTESCWLWTGAVHHTGYGVFTAMDPLALRGKRQVRTHRYAYELMRGPVPEGLCVCHRCDVRTCVNPEHLFLGTRRDNFRDAMTKGRTVHRPGAIAGGLASAARWRDPVFRARRSREVSDSNRRRWARQREGAA